MNDLQPQPKFIFAVATAILIGAWIIGMSVILAGWYIARQIATTTPTQTTAVVTITIPPDAPVLGNGDAAVTVVEFADYQCPFCGEWEKTVYSTLKEQYIDTGKVKFVYMDYAFLGEESTKAAEAAHCAADQGKYWQYHDYLYDHQNGENAGAFSDANLKQFAQDVQLDTQRFATCFDARLYKSRTESFTQLGSQYGVTATPTIFINGQKLEGALPLTVYLQTIDAALK